MISYYYKFRNFSSQPEIKDTKNHENRKVPIFDILYERLKIMKEDHSNHEYVFQSKHTFACILYKAGIDTKQAQQWTGHKDIRVLLYIPI